MYSAVFSTKVSGFSGIFLKMSTFNAHTRPIRQIQHAVNTDRAVILTYLIILRHIWVEIVFSMKYRRLNFATQSQSDGHS